MRAMIASIEAQRASMAAGRRLDPATSGSAITLVDTPRRPAVPGRREPPRLQAAGA
ncbi:MAG: hypothetical protein M0C28_26230 [Candidatus Moduliflexus flocculans]|nr:hypothetical protein [Candidatus Moduliflexus flocculans]